ncbi:MAG: helix-turn-helix transcriptional regulator [Chitinophagales bacterium]
MTYKELGQLIQKRRKNLGMTQVELGRLAEVSFRTIQNIELWSPFRVSPSPSDVERTLH